MKKQHIKTAKILYDTAGSNPKLRSFIKKIIIGGIVIALLGLVTTAGILYILIRAVFQPLASQIPSLASQSQQVITGGRTFIEQQLLQQNTELKTIEDQLKSIQNQLNQLTTPTPPANVND